DAVRAALNKKHRGGFNGPTDAYSAAWGSNGVFTIENEYNQIMAGLSSGELSLTLISSSDNVNTWEIARNEGYLNNSWSDSVDLSLDVVTRAELSHPQDGEEVAPLTTADVGPLSIPQLQVSLPEARFENTLESSLVDSSTSIENANSRTLGISGFTDAEMLDPLKDGYLIASNSDGKSMSTDARLFDDFGKVNNGNDQSTVISKNGWTDVVGSIEIKSVIDDASVKPYLKTELLPDGASNISGAKVTLPDDSTIDGYGFDLNGVRKYGTMSPEQESDIQQVAITAHRMTEGEKAAYDQERVTIPLLDGFDSTPSLSDRLLRSPSRELLEKAAADHTTYPILKPWDGTVYKSRAETIIDNTNWMDGGTLSAINYGIVKILGGSDEAAQAAAAFGNVLDSVGITSRFGSQSTLNVASRTQATPVNSYSTLNQVNLGVNSVRNFVGANRIPSPGDADFMGPVIKVGEGNKVYIPTTPLPMKTVAGVGDVPLLLTEANGLPHSVLGGKVASDGVTVYRQSATFEVGTWPKPNGLDIPWGRVDWTDHPYLPGPAHPNPHIHEFYYDFKQGQWRTTSAKPYYEN
ncbi:MAG: hypothetical protein K2P84_11465, partial [Undibacterium sp.]|nr:hypothetical protein [Undibacterium sp.]